MLGRDTENDTIFHWEYFKDETWMKIQSGTSDTSRPGIVKVGSDYIDIILIQEETLSIPDTKNPHSLSWPVPNRKTAIDIERERVFFASEEKIYILSFDVLFDNDS